MAINRNQHFVPRCYLRPFTIEGNGKSINLYNINSKSLIRNAPVKNQCSRDYFYGKDDVLEKNIQSLERHYSTILQLVSSPQCKISDSEMQFLNMFWLFQYLRTEEASRRVVDMSEDIRETIGLDGEEFRIEIRDAVQMAMQNFAESMRIVSDLKLCLVINKTDIPFVTSDNPAVLTNRWLPKKNIWNSRSFGLTSSGNIILLPLSQKILCFGYDGDVYSIKNKNGTINVKCDDDIDSLNQHQFINCKSNIYINDHKYEKIINDSFINVEKLRQQPTNRIYCSIPDKNDGTHTRYVVVSPEKAKEHGSAMVHTQVIHPVPNKWPKFLKWRTKGRVFTNGTAMGYVRKAHVDDRGPKFLQEKA